MFDFLSEVTPAQAIAGVHYAIRLIKHRNDIQDLQEGLTVDGSATEPSLDDQKLALQIIEEIQRHESLPLRNLSESKTGEYIRKLAELIQDRGELQRVYDVERGQRLLEKIREKPPAKMEYISYMEARRYLLDSIRRAFREQPAFCNAMDMALQEIRSALSAEKVLVTGWDLYKQEFRSFWASGISVETAMPIVPADGKLACLVHKPLPTFLSDQHDLDREFGGVAHNSAMNAPMWVYGNLQGFLSIIDIATVYQKENRLSELSGLVQEIANVLGQEIGWSLLSFGLNQQKIEEGKYSLAHLLHRGTKWIAAIFADLRGSTPAMEVLGLHGARIIDITGAHVSLPKPSRLIKEYCNCIAEKLCIHGRIGKLIGDAALGIIGDLFEETNDQKTVLRAICTATMMYDAFQKLVADWNDPEHEDYWIPEFRKYFNEDIDLRIGIGINYGPVIFDFFGSDDYKEYTAIGDTINTAERLEELASKPSESGGDHEPILISQTMFMRAEPFISNYKPYMLTLRGKARPVSACGIREFDRDACMALVQCKDCPGGQWMI